MNADNDAFDDTRLELTNDITYPDWIYILNLHFHMFAHELILASTDGK